MKKLAGLIAGAAFLASALPALAHGGSSNPNNQWYVNPADKNCMGQLARMHAQDKKWGTHGIPASFEMSTHRGFGLGGDFGDTVHDTMHAFQDYCVE